MIAVVAQFFAFVSPRPPMAEPIIFIRPVPFGSGFDVTIEPAPDDGVSRDQEFWTHKDARGYAIGLRLTHPWRIPDHADGVDV